VSHLPIKESSDLPLLLTVPDLAALLHIGKNNAYEMCHQPGFPVIRLGKQLRIPRDALLRWLDAQASPEPQPSPSSSSRALASVGK
jgi:excisionase family DNA binding protein